MKDDDVLTISLRREEWYIAIQAMAGFRDHCTRMAQITPNYIDVRLGLDAASAVGDVISKIRTEMQRQQNEGQ